MKRDDFLHVDTNLGKLEVAVIIIGVGIVKNWWGLIDYVTCKWGVSRKLFDVDELSRLIE